MKTGRKPTHGCGGRSRRTKEFYTWDRIIQRCTNQNYHHYQDYGGKGIKVCDRWSGNNGFVNFLEDLGKAPTAFHSIDRFPDGKGNYEPGNCRWATHEQQQNNRTNNIRLEFNGKNQTIAQWSRELNINRSTLYGRVEKGWPVNKILATDDAKSTTAGSKKK